MKRDNLLWPLLSAIFIVGLIAGLATGIHLPHHKKAAPHPVPASKVAVQASPTPQPKATGPSSVAPVASWAPAGYDKISFNTNFAVNNNVNPDCQGDSSLGKVCWTFQLVSKTNCSSVAGSLDMDNAGSVVATVSGTVSNVKAGRPFVLEIDSGAENDSSVDISTQGTLTALSCSR